MNITQVKRISVPVSDQDRAKDFYVKTLGMELTVEIPVPMGENSRWIEVVPQGADTSLILANWLPMAPGAISGLMLESTDIDGDCERLGEAGVEVDGPHETPWGKQATIKDPDGNEIVVAAPPPGSD